jgi:hypothetical protein
VSASSVTHNDFWWPLDLSAREDEAFDTFRLKMRETPWLRESVQMQSYKVAEHCPNATVERDPEWLELGRVRILFNNDVQPETVAAGMLTLIEKTYSELDTTLKNYRRG